MDWIPDRAESLALVSHPIAIFRALNPGQVVDLPRITVHIVKLFRWLHRRKVEALAWVELPLTICLQHRPGVRMDGGCVSRQLIADIRYKVADALVLLRRNAIDCVPLLFATAPSRRKESSSQILGVNQCLTINMRGNLSQCQLSDSRRDIQNGRTELGGPGGTRTPDALLRTEEN